jgi:two-component system chemotaxis response regulator CheB
MAASRHRDIILIGASAGGVEAIVRLVRDLPADLDAAVFITIHFPQTGRSVLPQILERAGKLRAMHPKDGARIEHGHIYVAPPDHHLMLSRGAIRLVRGPRENGHRPAVDAMFRSGAVAYGPRVIGVVLSGNLDDGTAGLLAIKRRGGLAVAQDPADALFPSMPTSALEHVRVDHTATIDEMGALLVRLVEEPRPAGADPEEAQVSDDAAKEDEFSEFSLEAIEDVAHHPGEPSQFGCPDCGGVLWEIRDENLVRYRCRVGHAWSGDALLARQSETLDAALWTALRALEESATLARQIGTRMRRRGAAGIAARFEQDAELSETRAETIRTVLLEARTVMTDVGDAMGLDAQRSSNDGRPLRPADAGARSSEEL